jgi:hypothetical protein
MMMKVWISRGNMNRISQILAMLSIELVPFNTKEIFLGTIMRYVLTGTRETRETDALYIGLLRVQAIGFYKEEITTSFRIANLL